jgi:hypothetical protein
MEHNEKCVETLAAATAWDEKYPNACTICHGGGILSYSENQSPLGSGEVWMMESSDLCTCIENDLCPRCGAKGTLTEDEETPCSSCGWNWGKGKEDFRPDTECLCWMEDLKDYDEREY